MMRLEVITTKGGEKLVRIPNSTCPCPAQRPRPVGVLEGGQTRVFFFLTQILYGPDELPHIVTRPQQPLSLLSDQCPMHLPSACVLVSEMELRNSESEKQENGRVCRDGESQLGGLL